MSIKEKLERLERKKEARKVTEPVVTRKVYKTVTTKEEPTARYSFTIVDYAIWIIGAFFIIYGIINPVYQIGILLGAAVLSTLLVKDNWIRGLTLLFDIVAFVTIILLYGVLGIIPPTLGDVMMLIFAFNTLTLFPMLASMVAIFSVVAITATIVKWRRFVRLSILIVILALIMSFINASITVQYIPFATIYDFFMYSGVYVVIFSLSYLVIFGVAFIGFDLLGYTWGKLHTTEEIVVEKYTAGVY